MFSIGKTLPDPPCACDESNPPLNSDESACPPQLPDLTHNPSLNFSIRNYVFAARSKDISTNWPFSLRNLQLCLKHGVKDPLPPFQSLDNVRNQSFPRSSVRTSCALKEISQSNSAEEPLGLNSYQDNAKSRNGLTYNFPPTTISVFQLETESVPTNRESNNSLVAAKPDSLLGISTEKEVVGPTVPHRTEAGVRLASKKGQLVVKLNRNLGRSSTEDIASTCTAVSDTMASKVCPVCKTFTSSSNTTLNAHIDQCLSEEPTPKWSAGSKLIRHRIKPRKTRLMVDIYETARRCTLEDLDRRNSSNWATGKSLPSQDTAEKKKQRVSSIKPDGDVGAVYIDSNGKKLRILSRFNNSRPSSSEAGEALGLSKCLKGKANKLLLSKKKKKKRRPNAQKHHKYLKNVCRSKDILYHKTQLHGCKDFFDARLLVSRSHAPSQPSDNGTIKQLACSRRSGASKKLTGEDPHPPLECTLHGGRDLLFKGRQSYFADNIISDGNDSDSPEHPRKSGRMGVPVSEEESPGKRKVRSPLFYGPVDSNLEESNFLPVKRRNGQSSGPFKSIEGCAFKGGYKMNILHIASRRSSKSSDVSPSKAMRFSKMEKKLSVFSLSRSKLHGIEKDSTPKWSEMHLVGEMNKEDNEDDSNPGSTAETQEDTGRTSDFQDLKYSDTDDEMNAESSISLSADHLEMLDGQDSLMDNSQGHGDEGDDNVGSIELQSKLGTENNALNFSKYLNQGTPIENRRIHVRGSAEIYKGSSCHIENPTFPGIVIEDICDGTNQQGSDMNLDLDTQLREEYEVERILIPGPPGSFLPSPGALGSEEFQGNSSLTSSRILSSQEQDLVNGDTSNSLISATSTVSDSAPAGSETKFLGPQELDEKARSGSSSGGCIEPFVSNSASTPQPSAMGFSFESKSVGKGPLILKNDDQPCCCQRKERSSQGLIPKYLESQLLRRRNLGSLTAIGLGKCPNRSPNNTTSIHMDGRHEMLPQSAPRNIASEVTRYSSVPDTLKGLNGIRAKVSDRDDSNSATPSACNPVLRLMGKNLMVVNKEDDLTLLGHSQSAAGTLSDNPSSCQVSRMTDVSFSRVPISSSGHWPALGNKLKTVVEPPAAPPGMSMNWHVSGYSNGSFYFPNQPPRSNVDFSHSQVSRATKEIVIIDDTPEDESTNMPANNVGPGIVTRERQASVAPVTSLPMKTTIGYDRSLAGTFPSTYDPCFFSQVPVSRQAGSGAIGVRWCSSLEGSGAFQQGHLVPIQSLGVTIRSQLPYPRGLP